MKKSKKVIRIGIIILFLITMSISLINRTIYGTWSVFSYPSRVYLGGYRYDNNGYIVMLTGDEKPKYEVSGTIDRFTGKRLYSKEKDFMGNGKVVYLHLDGNRYLALASGGGGCCSVKQHQYCSISNYVIFFLKGSPSQFLG